MKVRKTVKIECEMKVTVDLEKFSEEFLSEFKITFYPFDSVDDHMKHLAELHLRGMADWPGTFVEGYGVLKDMGIEFETDFIESEVL